MAPPSNLSKLRNLSIELSILSPGPVEFSFGIKMDDLPFLCRRHGIEVIMLVLGFPCHKFVALDIQHLLCRGLTHVRVEEHLLALQNNNEHDHQIKCVLTLLEALDKGQAHGMHVNIQLQAYLG